MKKIIITFLIFLPTLSFASPENLVINSSGLNVEKSNEKEIALLEVDNVIQNRTKLFWYPENRLAPLINDINEGDSRICMFCWLFAAFFAIYLAEYGAQIKKRKIFKKHWFLQPIEVGLVFYALHSVIHVFFASSIFLEYYWMVIFDELVVAYIYYYYILKLNNLPNRNDLSVKIHSKK